MSGSKVVVTQATVEDVTVAVQSTDGRLNAVSGGLAKAKVEIQCNPAISSVSSAITPQNVTIEFDAVVAELPVMDYFAQVSQSVVAGTGAVIPQSTWTCAKLPSIPGINLDLVSVEFTAQALGGTSILGVSTQRDGTLIGDVQVGAVSKINLETGACTIHFSGPLEPLLPVKMKIAFLDQAQENQVHDLQGIAFTGVKTFEFVLPHGPIAPTSISINTVDYQGRRMRVMDNGKGSFSGDIDTTNAGVVDYTTRRGAVTFISPVQPGVPVQVEAAYLASVAKFPQEDRVARVVITIPWEDFLRVSNTGSTIIDSAEAALKYR